MANEMYSLVKSVADVIDHTKYSIVHEFPDGRIDIVPITGKDVQVVPDWELSVLQTGHDLRGRFDNPAQSQVAVMERYQHGEPIFTAYYHEEQLKGTYSTDPVHNDVVIDVLAALGLKTHLKPKFIPVSDN